jgi:hypothetical protein
MGSKKSKLSHHGNGSSSNHHHHHHHSKHHPAKRPHPSDPTVTKESAQNALMRVYDEDDEHLPTFVDPGHPLLNRYHCMHHGYHPDIAQHLSRNPIIVDHYAHTLALQDAAQARAREKTTLCTIAWKREYCIESHHDGI